MADDAPIEKPTATAHCAYCEWKAQISGDETVDIVMSLRQILLNHVRETHPEQFMNTDRTHAIVYAAGKP